MDARHGVKSLYPASESYFLDQAGRQRALASHLLGIGTFNYFRSAFDDRQIGADAADGPRAALLPIPDLIDGEIVDRREIFLRQSEFGANRPHVDLPRKMNLCRGYLAAPDGKYLVETFRGLVECLGYWCLLPDM
jgi:hypothetical protein